MMAARLTKKFLSENPVIFFPQTAAEAIFIQRCLFALGQKWPHIGKKLVADPEDCVDSGIYVEGGKIYTLPKDGTDHFTGVICDMRALSPHFDAAAEKTSRQILELKREVTALKQVLKPSLTQRQPIDKKRTV